MKHKQWKRWTAALAAAAILFTPLATRAQTPDTTQQPQATGKPDATQKPVDGPAQTGDTAHLMGYVVALAAAAALLAGAAVVAKRRNRG